MTESNVGLRGRRSVELDLAKAEDRTAFYTLVQSADVVLDSCAPARPYSSASTRRHWSTCSRA